MRPCRPTRRPGRPPWPGGLLILLLVTVCGVSAQSERETLVAALESASGTERVDLLNQLAKSHWGSASGESLTYAEQARDEALQIAYTLGEAEAWRNIGIAYWYKSDLEAAAAATLNAKERFEAAGDRRGMAAALSTMGTIYLNLDQLAKARELYEEGLAIASTTDDENRVGILLSNLGTVHLGLEQPAEALTYLERSLAIVERQGSQLDVLTALANIGGAHRRLGDYERTLSVNQRILRIAEEIGAHERQSDALGDIGLAYAGLGDARQAETFLTRAVDFSGEHGLKRSHAGTLVDLANFYKAQDRPADALTAFERHLAARNEILNEENQRTIADLEVRYETARKEQEIAIQQLQIEQQRTVQLALTTILILLLLAGTVGVVLYRQKVQANRRLRELSRTDPLTGLANRRHLRTMAELQQARAGEPFSVLVIDIDHFKQVNDAFGHDCGDAVLTRVAALIQDAVRPADTPTRWGGEEFLILMPDTQRKDAAAVAGQLQSMIRSASFTHEDVDIPVRVTIGLASSRSNETFDAVMKRADQALLAGKQDGRDQVKLAV